MVTKFKNYYLRLIWQRTLSIRTCGTVEYFLNHYGEVNKKNLLAYKGD